MTLTFESQLDQSFHLAIAKLNTEEARERVWVALDNWLMQKARKKPVSDLPRRLEQFRKRIEALARNVRLIYDTGNLVVKASGDNDATLRQLKRGTNWFDPLDDVEALITREILNEQ